MHSQGYAHRDLKIENAFLDEDLNLVLGDFGVAKKATGTLMGTLAGTPLTMSPEVALSKPQSLHCDIWSLGCIWFQLLFGVVPFNAPNQY